MIISDPLNNTGCACSLIADQNEYLISQVFNQVLVHLIDVNAHDRSCKYCHTELIGLTKLSRDVEWLLLIVHVVIHAAMYSIPHCCQYR